MNLCVLQDICYILTMNRKYSEVELLLSCSLLQRLYPVLLLKALNDCPQEEIDSLENCDNSIFICESIKFLLGKCYPDLYNDYDLNQFYTLLKNYIGIVEYILHWKRRYFMKTGLDTKELRNMQSDAIEQVVSVKRIFSLLQKHSVLSVLKIATNIHEQDHTAIQDLLIESESENFQAYRSVVNALKAILLCESYSAEHKQITKCFTDMVAHLSSLHPFSLRIETMENIFSLLFLRHEDFNVTNANPKDDNCSTSFERTGSNKSVEYERSSFVPNKYAIRDMLHYLWASALAVKQEIDELQMSEEREEVQGLRESISIFTSALTDARWRLKFYMRYDFVENVGTPQDESRHSSATSKIELAVSPKLNFPHRIKGNTFFYKEDSTSDETRLKSDSSSESGLLGGNIRRRKRSRNAAVTADPSAARDRSSLINLMLASQESLVLHCLWKSDFQKAQEVIEVIPFCIQYTHTHIITLCFVLTRIRNYSS